MYWVAAGEVNLLDYSGAPAGRAKAGDLLGAADVFPPSRKEASWAWAAVCDKEAASGTNMADSVGPFRARTARVICYRDHYSFFYIQFSHNPLLTFNQLT